MNDNDIIKAWEEHYINKGDRVLIKNTIDLINRQKAEIERLKAEQEMADGYADALVERTKIKARKEFAEMIISEYPEADYFISNLLKEMEGEDN